MRPARGPTIEDYGNAVYDNFWYVLLMIALVTYVLLVRTFRSLLLPLKAVVLNLISVAAVFGAATWFWQEGKGSEAYDAGLTTDEAVVEGLGRTGRLVTSAALILFFAFAALAAVTGTDIKVFASALGVGILLDATVVRALLVPALVSLLGRWNWWLPAGVARVLRVQPSPLAPAGQAGSVEGEPEQELVQV